MFYFRTSLRKTKNNSFFSLSQRHLIFFSLFWSHFRSVEQIRMKILGKKNVTLNIGISGYFPIFPLEMENIKRGLVAISNIYPVSTGWIREFYNEFPPKEIILSSYEDLLKSSLADQVTLTECDQ